MEEKIEKLSEQDVIDVMKFAQNIYNNGNFFGVYTPQLLNQNLNALNNNPNVPTKESLDKALKDYKYNAELLQSYSEFAKVYDPIYNRAIEHYVGLMAFDMSMTCKNAYRDGDYKSQEYKDDKRRVDKFFDNFDYKAEFKKVLSNILRNEVYYTWFRDSEGTFDDTGEIELDDDGNVKTKKTSKYTLQLMPQERCLLTGYWESGLLYDFDMSYFLQPSSNINSFDPMFKKYWNETFGGNKDPHYNPSASFDNRTGTFATWTQTSPEDGAWAFKMQMDSMNTTPFLSSLIRQVLNNAEISKLQTDKYFLEARAILAGEIGMMDKQQSGQSQNAMKFNATTLRDLLRLVKMGLANNINAVAMPTDDVDFYQFENKTPDMYKNQLEITGGNGASASSLLFSTGKASQFELQSQIFTDYSLVRKVYPQFENFLNYNVNKKTRKYKFDFHLDGCTHPFVREAEKKNLLDLANVGMVLNPSAYSKIVDMTPTEFERSLKESKESGWTETMLSMLMSIHTQGKDKSGSENGRPTKSDNEIGENGSIAREYDS